MPFQPVTITTEVNVRYSINNQACENVIHYQWNSSIAPTTLELQTLAQDIYQTIGLKLMAMMHINCAMREVYARNIDSPTSNQATYSQTPPLAGQLNNHSLPNQVAKSIEKRTGVTGRSHHGGMRVSGLDTVEVVGDFITNSAITLFTNLMLSLIASRQGGRFFPAVASKLLGDSRRITSLAIPQTVIGSTDTRTTNPS